MKSRGRQDGSAPSSTFPLFPRHAGCHFPLFLGERGAGAAARRCSDFLFSSPSLPLPALPSSLARISKPRGPACALPCVQGAVPEGTVGEGPSIWDFRPGLTPHVQAAALMMTGNDGLLSATRPPPVFRTRLYGPSLHSDVLSSEAVLEGAPFLKCGFLLYGQSALEGVDRSGDRTALVVANAKPLGAAGLSALLICGPSRTPPRPLRGSRWA